MRIRLISTSSQVPIDEEIETGFYKAIAEEFVEAISETPGVRHIDVFLIDGAELDLENALENPGGEDNDLSPKGIDLLGVYIPLHAMHLRPVIKVSPEKILDACFVLRDDISKKRPESSSLQLSLKEVFSTLLYAVIVHELAHMCMDHRRLRKGHCRALIWEAIGFDMCREDAVGCIPGSGTCCCFEQPRSQQARSWASVVIEESLATAFEFVGLNPDFLSERRELLLEFTRTQPCQYAAGLNWHLPSATLTGMARSWMTLKGQVDKASWSAVHSQPEGRDPLKDLSNRILKNKDVDSIDFQAVVRHFKALENAAVEGHLAAEDPKYSESCIRYEIHKCYDVADGQIRVESEKVIIDGCLIVRPETRILPEIKNLEVAGCFVGRSGNLVSLKNLPERINGLIDISDNPEIDTLAGWDPTSQQHIAGPMFITCKPGMALLKTLYVRNGVRFCQNFGRQPQFEVAERILNGRLPKHDKSDDSSDSCKLKRALIDGQYDLIKAGFGIHALWWDRPKRIQAPCSGGQ